MGSPAQATYGTLAEYDIILSISEEAINRQFKLLYDKKIEGAALPPPPGMEGGGYAPPPPAKHLINHDLEIHLAKKMKNGETKIDTQEGIVAHIKSPTVSFKDSGTSNKARIEFEFERVEGASVPDSFFNYWVGMGPDAEIEPQEINGWKMSWEVKLGQKNIQNIMGELINPAINKDSPESLHPDAIKAITPLANEHFTIASIFCVFEAAQITDTFKLYNKLGQPVGDTLHVEFMTKVAGYFALLQSKVKEGRATPDHPFVLGYGLSQKIASVGEVQPIADPEGTPKFFIPKSYNVTVTPGKNSKYSNGTFNFCILTYREEDGLPKRDPVKTDITQNLNAGKLDQTFFDVTKTSEHDGLMAFSRDLIFEQFLCKQVANSFFIDNAEIFKRAMEKGSIDSSKNDRTIELTSASPPAWSEKQDTTYKGKVDHKIFDDKQSVTGYSKINVTWESDLQTNPQVEEKDARRETRLTFTSQVKEDFDYVDVGLISNDKLFAHVDMIYKYVLKLSPGTGGLIDFTKDDDASSLPVKSADGKLTLIQGERPKDTYGAYYTVTQQSGFITDLIERISIIFPKGFAELFSQTLNNLEKGWASKMADTAIAEYENKWQAGITSVKNKIILPAGNVFNFSGVDIDSQGNMYTHVSFANGAHGVTPTPG